MRGKRLLLSLVVGAAGGIAGAALALSGAVLLGDDERSHTVFAPETVERTVGSSTVTVTYPTIGDTAVTAVIAQDIEARVASFEQAVASATPAQQFELTGGFNRPYLTRDRLSYVQTVYEYTGGAHGMTHVAGRNLRRPDGGEIKLTDVFRKDSDYLQYLASSSRSQLRSRLPSVFEDGLEPTRENFDNFYLGPDSFVVIFPQYQVASYAAGTQEVAFSYEELEPYLQRSF
jgi:hypothetical protein